MTLFGVFHGIVADWLRSDEARREIASQVSEALKNNALVSGVEWIIVAQIRSEGDAANKELSRTLDEGCKQVRSEGQAAINRLNRISEESRAELIAALKKEAERLHGKMKAQLEVLLRSAEGKGLLIGVLKEALCRKDMDALTMDARARLKEIAADEVAALCADAEIAIQKSSEYHRGRLQREVEEFDQKADLMALKLIDKIFRDSEKHFQAKRDLVIDSILSDVRQTFDDFIHLDLPTVLHDAVESHVASGPRFVQPHSNRWLAAQLGISLREVKRRRRRGELPGHPYY